MVEDIFLARTEEQQQFRRMLQAMLPKGLQKHFPTFSKPFAKLNPASEDDSRPAILLFYGAGGMGKTSLVRRLRKLVTDEFKGQVNTLFLDWENEQKLTLDLQVGHDFIEPKTVLNLLHRTLVKAGWGNDLKGYGKTLQALRDTESKVEDALKASQATSDLSDKVSKLGVKGLASLIRLCTGSGAIDQEKLAATLDTTFQVGAEGLYQARRFVQKSLTPKEYEIYEQPNERLAEALGKGIAMLAEKKPLVLLFDTYEIVDRPECDYMLRRVIHESGGRTQWVIAGRSNLADSGQRGSLYFRGYKRDFAETQLYAKSLSEFGLDLIQEYFAEVEPKRPLSGQDADAVTRFSLGIPFVIRQAAVMYREGKPLAEIIAPVEKAPLGSDISAYDRVVTETSERFLMHCFSAKEREKDLQAIYALALMRRPDAGLLRAMLDETDLERRLQTLRERYSFILVEQLRLDEKLNRFLQGYLLSDLRCTSERLQRLNENALTWLELALEEKTQGITDTADKLDDEAIAELVLDLAHHSLWKGEDYGWRYLVPRFVEGWQYNRPWTRSLLEVAEYFKAVTGKENKKRLGQYGAVLAGVPDEEALTRVLDDLKTLKKRGWWDRAELSSILLLKQGQLLHKQGKHKEALSVSNQAARTLPITVVQLKKDLAKILENIGYAFCLVKRRIVPSQEGKDALLKAVQLAPYNGGYLIALGFAQHGLNQNEQAVENVLKGIDLEGEKNYSLNILGNIYLNLKHYDEAISAYEKIININPSYASAHTNLGNVYSDLERYDEAISAYEKAIELDPDGTHSRNNLGFVYLLLREYTKAMAVYKKAIELDHNDAYLYSGLGLAHALKNQMGEAHAAWKMALPLFENIDWDNFLKALYTLALGNRELAFKQLEQLFQSNTHPKAIDDVLIDANILSQCPMLPEGLHEFINQIRAKKSELENQPD
ncbi:tetratricopeptide repeat protein [Leptothoe sp. EHU-05/26/07-4]